MGCCMSKPQKSEEAPVNARPSNYRRGRQSYASSTVASWDTAYLPSKGLTPSYQGTPTSTLHSSHRDATTLRFNSKGDAYNTRGRRVGRSTLPSARDVWAC